MESTISLDAIAATVAASATHGPAAPAAPATAAAAAATAEVCPVARPETGGAAAGGGLYSGLSNMPGDQPPLAPTLRRDPAMDFRLEEPALEECAPCANVGPPPECPVCKHHHFQGTACEICGHVGKTNAPLRLFPPKVGPFPPILAEPPRKPLELKLMDGAADDVDLKLCQLIRDQVFVPSDARSCRRRVPECLGCDENAETLGLHRAAAREGMRDADPLDSKAAHVLGMIGDMPVGTCRLRVLEESVDASGTPQAWALDKLAVLQRYHRQGLGSAMVEQTVANAANLPAFSACTMVVADAPVEQGPFWQKLQFVPSEDIGNGSGRFLRRLA